MSNRLTFSLASLIFLIALGLVFAPMSVLAHVPLEDGTKPGNLNHSHPTNTIEAEDYNLDGDDTDPGESEILGHSGHVAVKSITVAQNDDETKVGMNGDEVVITTTDSTFTLVIEFNTPVSNAVNSAPDATSSPLAASEISSFVISGLNRIPISGVSVTIAEPTRVAGNLAKFQAVVTVPTGGIPSGTKGALDEKVIVGFRISAGAVATPPATLSDGTTTVNGTLIPLSPATPKEFTLVKALDSAPTVTITPPTAAGANKTLKFTVTSNESLAESTDAVAGTDMLEDTDFTVTNASVTSLAATSENTDRTSYDLVVTHTVEAEDTPADVKVTLNADSVTDATGNYAATASGTYTIADMVPPTVVIVPPTAPDANGNLLFTFTFSEPIAAFPASAIAGEDYLVIAAPAKPEAQPAAPSTKEIWTATVKPIGPAADDITIVLNIGAVEDIAGNKLSPGNFGRYIAPGPGKPTVEITANPSIIDCAKGSTITVTVKGSTDAIDKADINVAELGTLGWDVGAITKSATTGGTAYSFAITPKGYGSAFGVTDITVKVPKDAVKTAARAGIQGQAGNDAVDTQFTVGPVLTIKPGEYIVVIRPEHDTTAAAIGTHLRDPLYLGSAGVIGQSINIQHWECMPDLSVLFGKQAPGVGGGAIVVKQATGPNGHSGGTLVEGTVGISEVMWASDLGLPYGHPSNQGQTREQWIEIHNFSNSVAVKVTLHELRGNDALKTKAQIGGQLDRVSNYNIGDAWDAKGQHGNSEYGIDFVSMQRTVPTDVAKNYAHGDHNGANKDKWSPSPLAYLTRRAGLSHTGQLHVDNLNYDFKGSPGRSNLFKPHAPTGKTEVKRSPVLFNEIANRSTSNRYYEWIELRNVTDAEVNLREYRISYATAKDSDTELYTFPDNDDIKIPAKGVLLLVDTDPRGNEDHPIAADNPNVKYVVTDFKGDGLPDDGMFVLILRENNGDKPADLGTASANSDTSKRVGRILDVAGYDDNLTDASSYTEVWPLQVWRNKPYAHNKLEVETVHYRQHADKDITETTHGDKKPEHMAYRDVGYTGIGYKRLIPSIPAHGGTPGYDNGVAKEYNDNKVKVSAAPVTISEIMYDGNSRLPQWIELYNSSQTEVVKVEDWTLQIENADGVDDAEVSIRTPRVSVKFKAKLIQPNQTILIVASSTGNHSDHFPDSRIIDLYGDGLKDRDRLEIGTTNRRAFKFLSETAFKITLKDKAGAIVDTAGNLGRDGSPMWELPKSEEGAGRSSIIRRYNEGQLIPGENVGVAADGTLPVWSGKGMLKPAKDPEDAGMAGDAGWVFASASDLYEKQDDTYYGRESDIGTPGYRGGGPLPVSLSKFRPERLKETGEIVIRWITESELNNAGFNILRSETRNGEFTKINTSLIEGHGTTSERNTYEWKDTTAKPNVVYYYQIQDVSLDGQVQTLRQSRLKGNVTAAGKLTTTWGELKALQ